MKKLILIPSLLLMSSAKLMFGDGTASGAFTLSGGFTLQSSLNAKYLAGEDARVPLLLSESVGNYLVWEQ